MQVFASRFLPNMTNRYKARLERKASLFQRILLKLKLKTT
jgi:hypothetical protein